SVSNQSAAVTRNSFAPGSRDTVVETRPDGPTGIQAPPQLSDAPGSETAVRVSTAWRVNRRLDPSIAIVGPVVSTTTVTAWLRGVPANVPTLRTTQWAPSARG